MEVENRQGEQLGEVIDLIVDSSDDEVEYAILSFGGVGTLADKLFAYPLHRFDRTAARNENKLVLNVTRESLEDAPGFDRSLWPDFNRSEYRDQIERYYGKLAGSSDARYVRVSQMMDGDVKDAGGNVIGQKPEPVIVRRERRVRSLRVVAGRSQVPSVAHRLSQGRQLRSRRAG